MVDLFSRLEFGVPVGAIAAALLILSSRPLRHRELRIYSAGLVITAIAYLLFGLRFGAPVHHLAVESVGAFIFSAAALLGLWRWPPLLALGWSAHIAWDLFLHFADGPTFAPAWYPLLCVGFDLFLGGYIAGLIAGRPRSLASPHSRLST